MRWLAALLATIASCAAMLVGATAAGAEEWQTIPLLAPAGGYVSEIDGLNDRGDVVGLVADSTNNTHAAKWDASGHIQILPTLDDGDAYADYLYPADINNKGQISGMIEAPSGGASGNGCCTRPVRVEPTGSATFFPRGVNGIPDDEPGAQGISVGAGINNDGVVTGRAVAPPASDTSSDDRVVPFISSGGGLEDLWPHLPTDGAVAYGYDINDGPQPQVLAAGGDGTTEWLHAFLFTGPDSYTEYHVNPGYHGLNDKDEIVGASTVDTGADRYNGRAKMWNGHEYVPLDPSGGQYSLGNGINDFDWVAGREGGSTIGGNFNTGGSAYLWRPAPSPSDPKVINPNPLDLNSVKDAGWVQLMDAVDINEESQIAGIGYYHPPGADSAVATGFLMTPTGFGFKLTGKVTNAAGAAVPGVQVRVVRRFSGQEVAGPVTTGADGRYEWTLPPGNYDVTALPEGTYPAVPVGWCQTVGAKCRIALDRNREVDFKHSSPPRPAITNASFAAVGFEASVGTRLRLTLSQAAAVKVVMARHVKGHKVAGKCSPRTKTGPPCTLIVQKGSFSYDGKKGPNVFGFRPSKLTPGNYFAAINAHNATGTSQTVTLGFRIK